ncbi:hypothetical protein ACO0LM_19815 [Undibacterium sp. Di26W]|uniref:hypothetical protein n=1 Tax=Undibacterium sp. Di26W TaxID=3413035 RepID=UPI003BF34BED
MRKTDYTLLARIVSQEFDNIHAVDKSGAVHAEFASGYREALLAVANKFSDDASIKKAEFLLACGIK